MAALDKREEKIRNSRDKWNTMRERLGYELYPDLKEGEPWVAYGQFCRHFVAPLWLMAY
jgi:hypothetical protein